MSEVSLARYIAHLRALGFRVEPRPPHLWMVQVPPEGSITHIDQHTLKTLARACRHFTP